MSEVQVRIRHYDEANAVPFTTAPVEDLQRLIDQLQVWGGVHWDGSPMSSLEGQFVLGIGEAYFEIVLVGDDE